MFLPQTPLFLFNEELGSDLKNRNYEGCFVVSITQKPSRKYGLELKLRFLVHMSIRELELLKSLREFFGVHVWSLDIGTARGLVFSSGSSARYEVSSKADIRASRPNVCWA